MKTCSVCGEEKTLCQFSGHSRRPNYRSPACKACRAARQREHYAENREEEAGRVRMYCEANREAVAERRRKRYEANREAVLAQQLEYRRANREKYRDQSRKYYEANSEAISERERKHREVNHVEIAEEKRMYYEANREAIRQQRAAIRKSTLPQAGMTGLPWTGPEDSIVLRCDITGLEKAFMLGRTYSAVTSRIETLRRQAESA